MLRRLGVWLAVAWLAAAGAAEAQQATIKRTVLQKTDAPGNYEVVLGVAELSAATQIGKPTHPGTEQGTLVEGELTITVEGQPDAVYKPGQSWMIPAATPHDARAGSAGAQGHRRLYRGKGQAVGIPGQ